MLCHRVGLINGINEANLVRLTYRKPTLPSAVFIEMYFTSHDIQESALFFLIDQVLMKANREIAVKLDIL